MNVVAPQVPHPAWSLGLQEFEYGRVLPALSRLPAAVAYALAGARGRFNAKFDRDWVSLALGHRHVAGLTELGFREFLQAGAAAAAVVERFETASREELDARRLALHGLGHFGVDAQGALAQLARRPRDRGLVLLTSHYETFILGIAALAQAGDRVHPMMSSVSEDGRLAQGVRTHFAAKYAGLARHLNGGQLASAETQMRHLYRALQANEIVVVIADAPGSIETGLALSWLGRERVLAQGALRLAQATGSAMGAFMCRHLAGLRHAVEFAPLEANIDGHEGVAASGRLFAFMDRQIRRKPGRWWSAHLLTSYPVLGNS